MKWATTILTRAETPTWQYLSVLEYFEHRWPCDPTAIGKFRRLLGEEGVEELLAQTINVAVTLKLIAKKDLAQVIVDSTVQQKADHRLDCCHLKGEQGDRLHAVQCAAGINFRWLLRMIAKKETTFLWPLYFRLRGVTGMFQKSSEFAARVMQLVNRPSNMTALAHG